MAQDCPSPRGKRRPVDSTNRNELLAEGITFTNLADGTSRARAVNVGKRLGRTPRRILNARPAWRKILGCTYAKTRNLENSTWSQAPAAVRFTSPPRSS